MKIFINGKHIPDYADISIIIPECNIIDKKLLKVGDRIYHNGNYNDSDNINVEVLSIIHSIDDDSHNGGFKYWCTQNEEGFYPVWPEQITFKL